MKVRCLNCGLVLEKCLSLECVCPECGCSCWCVIFEGSEKLFNKPEEDSSMVSLAKEFLRVVKEEGIKIILKKEGVPDETMMGLTMKARDKRDKEEGLAFEIFEVFNNKKINVRKIYFNSHIEGFKGDPCIINHVYPKFIRFKAVIVDMIRQINEDYMRLAERHIMADMPITIELDCLRKAYLERINNIKI